MHRLFSCVVFLLWIIFTSQTYGQAPLLEYEKEFKLKSAWQEYMPDAYVLNDSTLLMTGLSVNFTTLTVNIFVRWLDFDGNIIREKEIFHMANPEGYTYFLSGFYSASTIDDEHLYVVSELYPDSCHVIGQQLRSYRIVKVHLETGETLEDSLLCFSDIRFYKTISSYGDSLYMYGSSGYLNTMPDILRTTMTKDLSYVHHQVIKTEDTHILPFSNTGDPGNVAGSHYRYGDYFNANLEDIWFGRVKSDSVQIDFEMNYYARQFLRKPFLTDTNEKAFLSFSKYADETSIFLFRDDTLAWNFYDAFFQEACDIQKINNAYCILQSSFRENDDRKDKIVLHYLDNDGFPYGANEYATPWILYAFGGLMTTDYYFVFVYISDRDELQLVIDNIIPKEEARFEYTHVFKFRKL